MAVFFYVLALKGYKPCSVATKVKSLFQDEIDPVRVCSFRQTGYAALEPEKKKKKIHVSFL